MLQKGLFSLNPWLLHDAITGFALLALCILDAQPHFGIISFVLFGFSIAGLFFRRPDFFLKYVPFLFAVCANIVGVVACEYTSVKLNELSVTSYFAGSLPLLIFSRWLFLEILFHIDSLFGTHNKLAPFPKPENERIKNRVLLAFELIAFMLVAVSFLRVLPNPSFAEGLSRFRYADAYMDGIWGDLKGVIPFLLVFPILSIRLKQRWALGVATTALYCLFLFWTGEKFGGYFTVACLFCLVFADLATNLTVKKRGLLCGALVIGFAGLVGFSLFAFSLFSTSDPIKYFSTRIAEQGQLWWKTYDKSKGEPHPEDFQSEIDALVHGNRSISKNIGSSYGIYRIMYYAAPAEIVDKHLASGARFTEGGYAVTYYYFGPIGPVLLSLFAAFLVFIVQDSLLAAIWRRNPFRIVIFTRFLSASRTALSMFVFNRFTSTMAIASYAYLIVERLLLRTTPNINVYSHPNKIEAALSRIRYLLRAIAR